GYTCPNGGSLSGTTCQKTTTYPATATYSCPNGGTVSGSSCIQTSTYPATASYTCNAGDSLSGSTCTRTTSTAATATYSCPNGGTLSGSQCTGTMTTKTAYVYLGGKQIAETVVGGATQYVHTDALGSPVAHTDQGGAVLNRTKFEPYGYTAAGTKPGPTTTGFTTTGSAIGFTGHVNDPDTDLVYMQQRYYDPTGSSFNRYNYANNSPYKYIDPDGRLPIVPVVIFIAKELAGEAFEQATGIPAPTLKNVGKGALKVGAKELIERGAKTGPKVGGLGPHNQKIREVAEKIEKEGGEILAGGGKHKEKLVPTPGGAKEGGRPDIIYRDANGDVGGVNVGKVKADGVTPVQREIDALNDLNGPGMLPTMFEKYN
ncbi:MAG: hypothetical protein K0R43_1359, partial [Pseudoduganella sp.]|nr:hypothetical protein [Pseudoduganella sp.]